MTEAEWLACDKLTVAVMNWLRGRGSNRQFYLAGCAAVRQLEHRLNDKQQQLIRLVEEVAAEQVHAWKLEQAHRRAQGEAMSRCQELQARGLSLGEASKRLTMSFAVAHATMPIGGFQAAFSAMYELTRAGKRTEIWARHCDILRDIFGNPFRPVPFDSSWRTSNVTAIAQAIYDQRAFERMPILADALEDAGCDNRDILDHCRQPGEHVLGCWVVDLILGKS